MRVALVHDWLTGMRGGERVLEQFCEMFPDASLFTLFHRPGSVSPRIESMPIRASVLNRIPGAKRYYRYLLPLFPWAVSRFDLRGFDLIISVSHAAAKGILKPSGCLHICYCLTPMRYIWDMQQDYFQYADRLGIQKTALRVLTRQLREWDRKTAAQVDHFLADSLYVRERILRYYGRKADVIYPPVDTGFFTPSHNGHTTGFYLVVSALVPYKRVDLAIDAFNCLGYPLVIVGDGPDLSELRRRAASNIQFRGVVSDQELRELYRLCRAAIVTAREDFGLVSLEAQACARPVVAFAAGGSLESVVHGETGILFPKQEAGSLIEGIQRLERTSFNPDRLRSNAERLSQEVFRKAVRVAVEDKWLAFHTLPAPKSERQNSFSASRFAMSCGTPDRAHSSLTGVAGAVKRCIDITVSLCGLVMLGLPLALIALLIRRGSPGPALFFQTRVGLRGRKFVMAKFRTMHLDAERQRGPTWAVKDDPRCTPVGGFLRRYGIDELPQFWNVLNGDMSLIGPRPERPEFQAIFETAHPEFRRRLEVRAGMSGLAQIQGWRGDTSMEERLRCDLEYIDHWSPWKDLRILFLTPWSLLRPKSHPHLLPPPCRSDESHRA